MQGAEPFNPEQCLTFAFQLQVSLTSDMKGLSTSAPRELTHPPASCRCNTQPHTHPDQAGRHTRARDPHELQALLVGHEIADCGNERCVSWPLSHPMAVLPRKLEAPGQLLPYPPCGSPSSPRTPSTQPHSLETACSPGARTWVVLTILEDNECVLSSREQPLPFAHGPSAPPASAAGPLKGQPWAHQAC